MKDEKETHESTDKRRAVDAAFEKVIEYLHAYREKPLDPKEVLKLAKEKASSNHSVK